jgi:hypothetical protein
MTDREAALLLSAIALAAMLAGPRRTRPIAGALYGLALSRGQAASRDLLMADLVRLFDERQSAHRMIRELVERQDELARQVRSALSATRPIA